MYVSAPLVPFVLSECPVVSFCSVANRNLIRFSFVSSIFAVAFKLYDLRGTGYIEKEEVLQTDHSLLRPVQFIRVHWFGYSEFLVNSCLTQLREMVVALLDESDLCLSDTAVEAIVDNVI